MWKFDSSIVEESARTTTWQLNNILSNATKTKSEWLIWTHVLRRTEVKTNWVYLNECQSQRTRRVTRRVWRRQYELVKLDLPNEDLERQCYLVEGARERLREEGRRRRR